MLWRANPGARRSYILATALMLAEGAVLVFGAPERSSGPAYRTINEVGRPHLIGALLLALAFLLAAAPLRSAAVARAGLIAAAAVHILMATAFATAAAADPHAGLLGPITMTTLAAWFVSQSVLYQLHPNQRGARAARNDPQRP